MAIEVRCEEKGDVTEEKGDGEEKGDVTNESDGD
jgi:hypothetical protein